MLRRIDGLTWTATAALAVGWFWLDALVATFGPVHHAAHFYDFPLVIQDPKWLITGLGGAHGAGTLLFGLLCVAAIAAPLLPRLGYRRAAWLSASAPLLLMLLCSILLYVRASSVHIESATLGRVGDYLARLANGTVTWAGDVVARHIAIGAGGYLAFLASLWLTLRGTFGARESAVPKRI
ncbi:MAG TPA: hypothetical protein VIY54_02860 [Steroidobacteraceae bacterium]